MQRGRAAGIRFGRLRLRLWCWAVDRRPALAQAPGPSRLPGAADPPGALERDRLPGPDRAEQEGRSVPGQVHQGQLDDATLVEIRDKYGAGSILRLADDPATSKYAQPLAERLMAAVRRYAAQPERIGQAVAALTGTKEEQSYAVTQLREAGPYAVPALVEALQHPELTPEKRALLVHNMGQLDRSAVPALLAVLDSTDPGSRPTRPRRWERLATPAPSRS